MPTRFQQAILQLIRMLFHRQPRHNWNESHIILWMWKMFALKADNCRTNHNLMYMFWNISGSAVHFLQCSCRKYAQTRTLIPRSHCNRQFPTENCFTDLMVIILQSTFAAQLRFKHFSPPRLCVTKHLCFVLGVMAYVVVECLTLIYLY